MHSMYTYKTKFKYSSNFTNQKPYQIIALSSYMAAAEES